MGTFEASTETERGFSEAVPVFVQRDTVCGAASCGQVIEAGSHALKLSSKVFHRQCLPEAVEGKPVTILNAPPINHY